MSNERGEWPQLLSQSFAKPLPFFLSHDTRTLPPVTRTPPPPLPLLPPLSPSSVCHSSIHASASLGCYEKENMMHVRNGILVLQYAVCIQCAVCKFPPEIPAMACLICRRCGQQRTLCGIMYSIILDLTFYI